MKQLFLIAIRNLIQNRKRTIYLGGAIAGVSCLLVMLLCLSSGMRQTMFKSATVLQTGHLNVGGFYKVTSGQSAPVVTDYKKLSEIVRQTLPDLDYLVARGRGWARLVSDSGSVQAAIGGLDYSQEGAFKNAIQVISGNLDELSQPGTIMIFEEQAKKLEVKVGDTLVISSTTTRGMNNTIDVRVVAIAHDLGILSSFNVFIPDESVRKLEQLNADATGAIQIHIKDIARIPQDMELLRNAFSAAGYQLMDREAKPFWEKFDFVNREDWTGQKLDITTWEEEMSFFKWVFTAIEGLMFVLTTILLVIISIGIMNSMWIAIRERTREIGTLRAIGMQRMRVMAMFAIEAFCLGSLATVAGAAIGIGLAALLNSAQISVPLNAQFLLMSNTLKLTVDFSRILTGMSVITACTTLVSLIPSIHAARMKPITAMHHIG
ncbi:MAG: ABC transporter permease [Bacteriovoracia bacterium]